MPIKDKFYKGSCDFGCETLLFYYKEKKKKWNKPEIIELDISSTEKHNGNHYGWNNHHNPHHCCHCGCHDNEDVGVVS